MIITIDGPSGTGKTSVAKRVAECLHFPYFDTGAMYRSFAWFVWKNQIAIEEKELEKALPSFHFSIRGKGSAKRYFVGDIDVSEEIRLPEVTEISSQVAIYSPVRKAMWKIQRDYGAEGNAVFEGRDMGSVVFPNAEIKVFLTASSEVRAMRRWKEFRDKYGKEFSLKEVQETISKRDENDQTRKVAPLTCPEDALVIDTSNLSLDEVVDRILSYKIAKKA